MTLNELFIELSNCLQMGFDPDTPVVVRDETSPDTDVTGVYFCTETEQLCLSIS